MVYLSLKELAHFSTQSNCINAHPRDAFFQVLEVLFSRRTGHDDVVKVGLYLRNCKQHLFNDLLKDSQRTAESEGQLVNAKQSSVGCEDDVFFRLIVKLELKVGVSEIQCGEVLNRRERLKHFTAGWHRVLLYVQVMIDAHLEIAAAPYRAVRVRDNDQPVSWCTLRLPLT